MNPHRAAALALVGWYLMLPPCKSPCTGEEFPATDAPFSRWTLLHSYDTAEQCEQGKYEQEKQALDHSPSTPTAASIAANRIADAAACIATDDPRLKRE
jgi:hypothetical protein